MRHRNFQTRALWAGLPAFFSVGALAVGVSVAPAVAGAPGGPSRDIGGYVVFATDSIEWGGAASMPAGAALAAGSGTLRFSADTDLSDPGSYAAAPLIEAGGRTVLARAFATEVALGEDATLLAPPEPFEVPLVRAVDLPRVPEFGCGGYDITVDADNTPVLLPGGTYGVVTVTSGNTLSLVEGATYELCSLRLRGDAVLEVHGDNTILVAEFVSTAQRARIVGDGACRALWVARGDKLSPAPNSAAFDFASGGAANRSTIAGTFFTEGKISMAQHNDYAGRFWAGRIEAAEASAITRTLAACPGSSCGDGRIDPGEQCDDGNNLDGDCCSALCTHAPVGLSCDDGFFCNGADTCAADGRCVGSGDPCAGPDGDSDCSESCSEAFDACTAPDTDGSPCDDGNACTTLGACTAGRCVGDDPIDCTDDDLCTFDYCDPLSGGCSNTLEPDPTCHVLGEGFTGIAIGESVEGKAPKHALKARWRARRDGEPTVRAMLGDPRSGDGYALCMYDSEAGSPYLAYRLDVSPETMDASANWRVRDSANKLVFTFSAAEGTSQGVSKMKVLVDKDDAVKLALKAGANSGCGRACRRKFAPPVPVSDDRMFDADPGVTVQWAASTGACWATTHVAPRTNDRAEFRASD